MSCALGAATRLNWECRYEALHLPAAVLLDNVRSMYNVGAFFRAADGVGLEKLCLCGITACPPKKAISKTALGAEECVLWKHDWDAVKMADGLRRSGFEIAAIETGPHSVDLFHWQPNFPVCVAFGNEVEGLNPELLKMADAHVRIPMLGRKSSLNVATAGGIVLYELLRKYCFAVDHRAEGSPWRVRFLLSPLSSLCLCLQLGGSQRIVAANIGRGTDLHSVPGRHRLAAH